MSGSNTAAMNASLTLRLQDRLSAGLGALKQKLDGIRGAAERIGALGAIGSGLAIGAPIVAAAGLDKQLRDIAVTAGKTGDEAEQMISRLRLQFEALAIGTAQSSRDVATAAGLMMQRGLATDLIERMLPITAKVATGTSSAIGDIAGVVYDLNQTLDVTPDKIDRALSMLVQSAREGKVELRDMAKEFPALASAANSFGFSGLEGVKVLASAMQVAAKASATPAEAANNMANLFQALRRPETLKTFKEKFSTDFEAIFKDAMKRGINPLEAAVQQIRKVTGGDTFKLGALIPDMQANKALLPFIKDVQAYLDLRDRTGAADPIILDQSFAVMMAGASAQLAVLNAHLQRLSDRFGTELFGRIKSVLSPLESLGDLIALSDRLAPSLIGKLVTGAAAFLALSVVLGALITVFPVVLAGMKAIGLMAFFFVPLLVKGLAALAAVAGTIAAPVLAVVAAVALIGGAIYTIWSRWDEFSGFFSGMLIGLRRALFGFIIFLDGVFSADWSRIVSGWGLIMEGFGNTFGNMWQAMSKVVELWAADALGWIGAKAQAVVDKFKEPWLALTGWFASQWETMTAPINRFLEKVMAAWSALRSLMGAAGGASAAPAADGNPAAAGTVARMSAAPLVGHIGVNITADPGLRVNIGPHSAWLNPENQREIVDRYRAGRGPVDPVNRQ